MWPVRIDVADRRIKRRSGCRYIGCRNSRSAICRVIVVSRIARRNIEIDRAQIRIGIRCINRFAQGTAARIRGTEPIIRIRRRVDHERRRDRVVICYC